MKRFLLILATVAIPSITVSAQTITFEDATGQYDLVANGYHGLNWHNFRFLDATNYVTYPSGYSNGRKSGDWVAYNSNGESAQISGNAFFLQSAWFSAAWFNDLTLSVTGYVGGTPTYFATSILQTYGGPQQMTFNWSNLSSVDFTTSGGTPSGYIGCCTQLSIDDLNVTVTVSASPEPTSVILLGTGLVGIGVVTRRRRTTSV